MIWLIHELSRVWIDRHVRLMWTCHAFLFVVDRRWWQPNNSLQSLDHLFIYNFLSTLEANISEGYNGYVCMVYQTQCDPIAWCNDDDSTICYEHEGQQRQKYPIWIVNNSYNLSWQWLKKKQIKMTNMCTLSWLQSEQIWLMFPLYLLQSSTQWPHVDWIYYPR